MNAAVSRLHFPITTLGPGHRVGLWLQGCSLRCPGCISADTWEASVGMIPVPHLLGRIADLAGAADGLTVSGGEPFEQPEVLALVLRRWRQVSSRSTFVYTGWEFEDVAPWLAANKGLVDAVMTGPFRSELPQTRALRGSDNQTLHVLSELGAGFLAYERPSTPADRRLDVEFDDKGEAWFAGIPARGDLARLRRAFAASGHSASTSDMVGGLAG